MDPHGPAWLNTGAHPFPAGATLDLAADILILGGGVAGAATAFFTAPHARVLLLEAEAQLATHSSGRSAAQFTQGITAPVMRRMATASRAFLEAPPRGFAEVPLLRRRACLTFGRATHAPALDRLAARLHESGAAAERLDEAATQALFPPLRPGRASGGAVLEPDAADLDTDALLGGYTRGARAQGARILTGQRATALRHDGTAWEVTTAEGRFRAPLLLNAAGAWVDEVARMAGVAPIGIRPCRRTAFTFAPPAGMDHRAWPHVADMAGRWYLQPDAGQLLASPADATPTPPCDAMPDDLDIAQAIDRIGRDTSLRPGRPLHRWAGLRSFVADREPVVGAAPDAPGFHWLAGQGGCGLLASPALGQAAAAALLGLPWPEALAEAGVSPATLSPSRLR
jgi:D-arginine dehydrogenase